MTPHDAPPDTSAIVPFSQKDPFEPALKELLYEIWLFLADRNPQTALEILEKQLSEMSPEATPFSVERLPTVRTVQRWVKNEKWDEKANDHMRRTAKSLDETQISRMFVISDLALSFAYQLLRDGYNPADNAGILAVKWDAAKEMLRFRGLGTAGVVGAPTLEVKIDTSGGAATVLEGLSAEEKAEFMRQRTLEQKQTKRLTSRAAKN